MVRLFFRRCGGCVVVLAVCAGWFAAPVFADGQSAPVVGMPDTALDWLAALRDARRRLSFRGTAALLRDNQVQMVVVTHCVVDGVERDSMRSLDNPEQKIVRQAGRVTYFLPETKRALAGNKMLRLSHFGVLPEELSDYQRYYRFSLGARETLIGRLAQEVIVEPVDGYRYSRRFWIDADNKLPLKYQVLDDGKLLEQLVLSQLTLTGPKDHPPAFEESTAYRQETLPLEALQWRLDSVPPGYRLVSYMRHDAAGKKPLEHLLLSDGLSALSLYLEETDGEHRLKQQVRRFGAIHLYLRPIGRYQATVMGEAPLAAVGLVGEGVRRLEKP